MSVGRNVGGASCPGASCPGASCPGASCLGASCPGASCLGASGPGTKRLWCDLYTKNCSRSCFFPLGSKKNINP
jgi:hypothetical protein